MSNRQLSPLRRFLEETRAVRHVRDPAASPCFRAVTRVWHFPSGDALLERDGRRDCLLTDVDHIDVPVDAVDQIANAVAIETDTTLQVLDQSGERKVTEFDRKVVIER